jgi:hypothetical protein
MSNWLICGYVVALLAVGIVISVKVMVPSL